MYKSGDETKVVSVVIPALNEEEAIEATIRAIPKERLESMGYSVEVIVVDNGSEDRTGDIAQKAGAKVVYEPRRGYGYAYKAGFRFARGEIIATADADLSYPMESIPDLIRMLGEKDLDFITTNRFAFMSDGAMSRLHKLGNAVLNMTVRVLFSLDLKDSQSGMWVFKRDLLPRMVIRSNSMAFSEEVKLEACYFLRCRWLEVPIQYRRRVGTVKIRSWRDGFTNLIHLFRKRLNRGSRGVGDTMMCNV